MKGARRFSEYLKKELKDRYFKRAFEKEGIYTNLAIKIAQLRQKEGYSQRELARLLHTTQQTISRLENPDNNSVTMRTLIRLARIFKKNLKVQFV